MGVTVAVDRVACNTGAAGNQAITVSAGGLTPKAALFILMGATTDGTTGDNSVISYGAATGTSNRWVNGVFSQDNVGTTATQSWYDDLECIQVYDESTTLICEADFVSFAANTVTINWSTTPASAWLLTVVTFSGSDVSAYAGSIDLGNAVDYEAHVTTVGFEPDVILPAMTYGVTTPGQQANAVISYGVVYNDGVGAGTQRALSHRENDNLGTVACASRQSSLGGVVEVSGATGLLFYGEFTNFDSSGFSCFTRSGSATNSDLNYLALAFNSAASVWVGDFTTHSMTG
jgi:hypothetical protein